MLTKYAINRLSKYSKLSTKHVTLIQKPLSDEFIKETNPHQEIVVSDIPHCERILDEFRKNPKKLVIVTDFDYTLTKKMNPGAKRSLYSTFCVLQNSGYVSEAFVQENKKLFQLYHGYEADHSISFELRDYYTHKWFKENMESVSREKNLQKHKFKEIILSSKNKFYFRNGIKEMFDLIEKFEIPLYIISGGIKDVIDSSLNYVISNYSKIKNKNLIKIISNEFNYNKETNEIENCVEPMIYTFNKHIGMNKNYTHEKKPNVILMGDHLRDVDMVKDLEFEQVLKFGFLNTSKEDLNYDHYKKTFDITIVNDGDLHYINNYIKQIYSK